MLKTDLYSAIKSEDSDYSTRGALQQLVYSQRIGHVEGSFGMMKENIR